MRKRNFNNRCVYMCPHGRNVVRSERTSCNFNRVSPYCAGIRYASVQTGFIVCCSTRMVDRLFSGMVQMTFDAFGVFPFVYHTKLE